MKATLPIMLLTLLAGAQPIAAADPSPEFQQVLKERMVGKHDLKVNDLSGVTPTPGQLKRLDDKSTYESYHVPVPKGSADYYAYSIYRFNQTGEIWIVRSGGFAGRTELFIVPKANH